MTQNGTCMGLDQGVVSGYLSSAGDARGDTVQYWYCSVHVRFLLGMKLKN